MARVAATLVLDGRMEPRGDERVYLYHSLWLWNTGDLETGAFVRPPLYIVLIAGFHGLAGWSGAPATLLAKLAQCVAGTAAAIPVYLGTGRLAGRRAARLGAAFLLLDPTLVAYCHLLWPETFLLLLVALVCGALPDLERRPAWQLAGVGLLIGTALLLKPAFGLFTLLLAGSWVWRFGLRRAIRLAFICGGVAALVIAPWVVRNQVRYGPAIVLENQLAYNLWAGNDPAPVESIGWAWHQMPDPVTRSREAVRRGMRRIAEDPARFWRNSAIRALNLWGLEYFVVRHVLVDGYGPADRRTLLGVFWPLQAAWAVVLVCVAGGLRTAWRDPTLRLLLVHAAVFTLMVSGMVTTTRFRMPFAFMLSVVAALGADRMLSRRLRRSDWIAVACAVAVLGLSATRPVFRAMLGGGYERTAEIVKPDWVNFRY